jgi:hypothetical protein
MTLLLDQLMKRSLAHILTKVCKSSYQPDYAVEQHDHEPIRAIEKTKNRPDLLPRQYHWQPRRPFGPDNTVADLLTQNLAAEKSDSI